MKKVFIAILTLILFGLFSQSAYAQTTSNNGDDVYFSFILVFCCALPFLFLLFSTGLIYIISLVHKSKNKQALQTVDITDPELLWHGSIVRVRIFNFVSRGYAFVFKEKLVIKNGKEILFDIPFNSVSKIIFPTGNALSSLYRGFKGFTIFYTQNGIIKTVRFYPIYFWTYPGPEQTRNLSIALGQICGQSPEEIIAVSNKISKQVVRNFYLIGSAIIGFLLSRLLGILIFPIATAIAFYIYDMEDISPYLKIFLIFIVYVCAFLSLFIILFGLEFLI